MDFETNDIVLAASLRCEGYPVVGMKIAPNGKNKRGTFLFEDVPENLLLDYHAGRTRVEPGRFNTMIRQLTTAVKQAAAD